MNLIPTSSGDFTCRIGEVYLHSRHNPLKEAERFYHSLTEKNQKAGCQIILGAGLGYINKVLSNENDQIHKIISIFACKSHFEFALQSGFISSSDYCWFPESNIDLDRFLKINLKEQDSLSLNILIQPTIKRIYGKLTREAEIILQSLLTRYKYNLYTTRGFGRRWIKNILSNMNSRREFVSLEKSDKEIMILASGPTLNKLLPDLDQYQERYRLWALPSSLSALRKFNIIPEAVISTDPGYYAREHFKYLDPSTLVISPLDARWPDDSVISLFFQNSPLEPFFQDKTITNIERSVSCAGSAILLALTKSSGQIILAGLDFASLDIQDHVKPHSFRVLLESDGRRIVPYHHNLFSRSHEIFTYKQGNWRVSAGAEEFRKWIMNLPRSEQSRLIRINPSPVELPGIDNPEFSPKQTRKKNEEDIETPKKRKNSCPSSLKKQKNSFSPAVLLKYWNNEINQLFSLEYSDIMKMDLTRNPLYYLLPDLFFESIKSADKWNREKRKLADKASDIFQELTQRYGRNHF